MLPSPSNLSSAERSNREHGLSLPLLHAVIMSLITTLGGYLQVQYQFRRLSPMEEHGTIMLAIYVFLSLYAVGLMAEFKLRIPFIKRFTPLIGILVVVLLLIILFPLLGLVAFIMWALYMMEAVIKSLKEIAQWFHHIYSRSNETIRSNLEVEENQSSETGNDSTVTGREDTGLPV